MYQLLGHQSGLIWPAAACGRQRAGSAPSSCRPTCSRACWPREGYTLVVNASPREAETDRCTAEEFVNRFGLKLASQEAAPTPTVAQPSEASPGTELIDSEFWPWIAVALLASLLVKGSWRTARPHKGNEARNPKHEANQKPSSTNVPNQTLHVVSIIAICSMRACFVLRASDFEFRSRAAQESARRQTGGEAAGADEAAGGRVHVDARGQRDETLTLHDEPILRFSNPVSGVPDGIVVMWKDGQRPAVFAQVFQTKEGLWVHECQSLASRPAQMQAGGQSRSGSRRSQPRSSAR